MPPLRRMFGLLLPLLIAIPYVPACPLVIFPSALNGSYSEEASLMERSIDPILPNLHARNSPSPEPDALVVFDVWLDGLSEEAPQIRPDKQEFHDRDPNYVYIPAEIALTIQTVVKTYLQYFDHGHSHFNLKYQNDFPYDLHSSIPLGGVEMLITVAEHERYRVQIDHRMIAGIFNDRVPHFSLLVFPARFTGSGVNAGAPEGQSPHVPRGVRHLSEVALIDNGFHCDETSGGTNFLLSGADVDCFTRVHLDFKNDFPEGGDETTFTFVFQSRKGPVDVKVKHGIGRIEKGTSTKRPKLDSEPDVDDERQGLKKSKNL
ncbi:hypothetical protein FB446DRAFT_768166 [Lentinula raphanica]|nr:hypothetical protein FB446DRAFT_768166 [Lentinula raphanica]